jgi:hypothetical protein
MLINSSELRVAGFKVKEVLEVLPPAPEAAARGGCGHEEKDCEVLRAWALKVCFVRG